MTTPDTARRAQALVWLALGAACASLFIRVRPDHRWAPLTDYPTQTADADVSGPPDKPPVITAYARKCADETVDVFGAVTWQRVEPPGQQIAGPEGQAKRVKGCSEFTFKNPVPVAVWADVCEHGPSTWLIVGTETPFRPEGTGEVKRWTTTPIRMTCTSVAGK